MIDKLDNSNIHTARQIFEVFQSAYQVEAQLIGVQSFPPLSRGVKDIVNSKTLFYGISEGQDLLAIMEVTTDKNQLDIHSLTVAPNFFGQGLASLLISHVLKTGSHTRITVETAVANKPAVNLYKKHGFAAFKKWTPSHGIPKVALSIDFTGQQ